MTQKTAFVFPGQGSQTVGMLADFASEHPVVKQTFQQASDILGYDLWELTQHGPADKLNLTEHAQPALLTAGVATWRALQKNQIPLPAILAGHSLGEYTALVCANAIDFNDAISLVEARGQYMQQAVPAGQGAMAAIIGLDDAQINELCDQARGEEILSPANFNSIGQIVIAGNTQAIERAIKLAKEHGAKIATKLPVSVPSHCALMRPAAEKLQKKLDLITIKIPEIPVINNVDVKIATSAEDIKSALIRQLYSPVRWVETIEMITSKGVGTILECGPGKVLAGLIKRTNRNINLVNVHDATTLKTANQE